MYLISKGSLHTKRIAKSITTKETSRGIYFFFLLCQSLAMNNEKGPKEQNVRKKKGKRRRNDFASSQFIISLMRKVRLH